MTRSHTFRRALLAALLLAGAALHAAATWPNLMNYQGQLTDISGNAMADGPYTVKFAIYTVATGGSNIWNETQTITASKGLFNAILGSVSSLGALTPAQTNADLWLGITVGGDPEMTPRQQLLGPINANNAASVGGLLPNNTANNLVVLDSGGKIPAGLIQGGSIQFPLAMSGNSNYGLSVANNNAAPSAVGLSVVASSGIQGFATDPAGSGLAGYSGSNTGYAVSGTNTSATGVAVLGQGFVGVQGIVNQSSGSAFGVQGIVSGTSSSNAIAVAGYNYIPGGTGISGRALGNGPGTGVRGSVLLGANGVGVLGTVSGTTSVGVVGNAGVSGDIGVEGYTEAPGSIAMQGNANFGSSIGVEGVAQAADSTGLVGVQNNAAPTGQAAGVHGYTTGLQAGVGVLGEGNQGVYGNSGGACGVCAVNQNPFGGAGLSASSPVMAISASGTATAIQAQSTGTSSQGLGVVASVASTVATSAAGQFNATGASGQTFGLNVTNASPAGTGIQTVGGLQGVSAKSVGGGTNFNSDGSNGPAFGFQHTDNVNTGGGVGVFSSYGNCPTCIAGQFVNAATAVGVSQGAAVWVQGRLNVSVPLQSPDKGPAGTFVGGSGNSSQTFNNPYITATSLIFLTAAGVGVSSVASVTGVVNGQATINFNPPLGQNFTYQYLIIGQ
jgi:hypothetical protein